MEGLSVLFSEPKIPQYARYQDGAAIRASLSVLFSEPKIPQLTCCSKRHFGNLKTFSALQRAENSSILVGKWHLWYSDQKLSVLFSEPKIPQWGYCSCKYVYGSSFSALQRAENSSIQRSGGLRGARPGLSVLFSEPKIPQ